MEQAIYMDFLKSVIGIMSLVTFLLGLKLLATTMEFYSLKKQLRDLQNGQKRSEI
jgi:hypothetical protein